MKIVIMHARAGEDGHFILAGAPLALFLGGVLMTAIFFGAVLQQYLRPMLSAQSARDADFLRDRMNLLAAKVGVLQAELVSLDGLGQRVARVAGVAPTDPKAAQPSADASFVPEATQAMDDLFTEATSPGAPPAEGLGRQLDQIQERLLRQTDHFRLLDRVLTRRSADQARVSTAMPITDYPYLSSSYGWRRNPVTGRLAMHEGLDFAAPSGTLILAASGGVVLQAKSYPGYGKMVEIDHGEGLVTRYAHALTLMVKRGQRVERGQPVARVGSTGRSTGPHLHFEVRLAGQPLDPRLFLGPRQNAPSAVAQAGADSVAR